MLTPASLTKDRIRALIPHAGTMCLLDHVVDWSAARIECRAVSHDAADNPLRHDGRIAAVAGLEYGLQAMAVHGALRAGERQPVGYLVRLGAVRFGVDFLDQLGAALVVRAEVVQSLATGYSYGFSIAGADGRPAIEGRATIALVG
jgi:predicted hotdog family 3-hydroxylacyl-ACP dehydratase